MTGGEGEDRDLRTILGFGKLFMMSPDRADTCLLFLRKKKKRPRKTRLHTFVKVAEAEQLLVL